MLTPFGKAVRKHRIDKMINLCDMASALGKSPAFISAIETGRTSVPDKLLEEICVLLQLSEKDQLQLKKLASLSKNRYQINARGLTDNLKQLVAEFIRNISNLSLNDVKNIREILKKYE